MEKDRRPATKLEIAFRLEMVKLHILIKTRGQLACTSSSIEIQLMMPTEFFIEFWFESRKEVANRKIETVTQQSETTGRTKN